MAPREPRRDVTQPQDQFESVELALPRDDESPESVRPGFCCAYEAYFAGFAFGVPELMELLCVRISKKTETFAIYPNLNRNLVYGFPEKDSGWMDKYFFFRITKSSFGDMHEVLTVRLLLETQTRLNDLTRFEDFYRVAVEANAKWNSFSLERIHGVCARIRERTLRESASPQKAAESSPPSYRAKRERETRLATLAKVKKEEISVFKASGEKTKVSLVAEWVLEKISDELNALVSLPNSEEDGEEEEESLERRKRKRGTGGGSTHHTPESSRARGSEDRLLIVNAENRRDRERVSNLFRTFSHLDVDIPVLDNMREPVRDLYVRHSIALAESATSFNRLLCGYERMLTDPGTLQSELTTAKEKLSSTERALETMRVASERNADRLRRVDDYRRQRDEARATAAELETKVALMLKRAEIAEEKNSRFEARKDVKGIGASVVNQVKDHLSLLKARFQVEREFAKIKAKQDFLVGIQKGEYPDFNVEAANMNEVMLAVKGKLAAMPLPSLDLEDLARMLEELSPPSEEIESEMALVHVDVQADGGSAPLAAVPPMSASFDQFGSMVAKPFG
ncbi:unnamed protein product [Cochlearia groenlandica]